MLLLELQTGPRVAVSELARRIGMSAPAVRERIQRLEASGVIAGYRLLIDPASVGLPITAFVRVRPAPGALPKIAKLAEEIPEVTECYRIAGEDCFLIKLHAPALEQMEGILDRFVTLGNTTTSIVVSTTMPARQPPLPRRDVVRKARTRGPDSALQHPASTRGCACYAGPESARRPRLSMAGQEKRNLPCSALTCQPEGPRCFGPMTPADIRAARRAALMR